MHTVILKVSVTVTTLCQQSPFVQCTANSSAEVSPSRQSVGFIYKWAHRRANDSFHACGEQITVQKDWLQLSSWALIQCHRNKVILLHSEIKSHFFTLSASAHGEVCPDLIGVEFAVRVGRSDSRQKTMGSTAVLSPRLILPTHHMYNFTRRWVCWAVGRCCLSFPSTYRIRLSQTLYIPNVLPLRRRAPASYHFEKGTSVADFTHALWGHCTGLPASPSPTHTHSLSHSLTSPSLTFISPLWVDTEQICLPPCTSLWKSHSLLPAEGPQLTS